MVFQPRQASSIYSTIRNTLTDRIDKISNFVPGSFNNAFLLAYSDQIREAEIKALASELAGYVDYAGKTLTEDDLRALGIDNVDPQRINVYMDDRQLDFLADNYGVERDPGTRASGNVTLTANTTTTIENGYTIGTQPDANGEFLEYYVVASGSPESYDPESTELVQLTPGENTVTVVAEDVGPEYNVGADKLTYMPNPASGVESARNKGAITNGEDAETNGELRAKIKESIFSRSGGGTELGMKREIEQGANTNIDVSIDEYELNQPPFVDVVVDGGDESRLKTLIEQSKPIGIEHNLVRPNEFAIDIFTTVSGDTSSIDKSRVEEEVTAYLSELELGDRYSSSGVLNAISTSQGAVESVPAMNQYVDFLSNEQFTYSSGTNRYELGETPLGNVNAEKHYYDSNQNIYTLYYHDVDASSTTVEVVSDDTIVELTRGSSDDYEVIDDDSDGNLDSIDLHTGVDIDVGTTIRVSYTHNSYSITEVRDGSGSVYTQGTDYGLIDDDGDGVIDTVDWSVGGDTPSDGDRFYVEYDVKRSFEGDAFASDRQVFDPNDVRVERA